ncbi:MAG: hypothetical protein AB1485_04600 [Candidatus Thermoplasmatota archaeon]
MIFLQEIDRICNNCFHFHNSFKKNIGFCFWQPTLYKYSKIAQNCDYFFPKKLKRKVRRAPESLIWTREPIPQDTREKETLRYLKDLRKGLIDIGNRFYVLKEDYE